MKALPALETARLFSESAQAAGGERSRRRQRRRLMAWLTAVWCAPVRASASPMDNARFTTTRKEHP